MGDLPNMEGSEILPQDTIDLITYMRQRGFGPEDIEFIQAKADPEVCCRSLRAYQRFLEEERGTKISYSRICELNRMPAFHECVTLLYAQLRVTAFQAIEKALIKQATDPDNPRSVAAATLLYKKSGLLDKGGGRDEEGAHHQLIKLLSERQEALGVGGKKRRFIVEETILPSEEDEAEIVDNFVDTQFSLLGDVVDEDDDG